MDYFCGSAFWNASLIWNTDNPDFTPCFQKTVLVWIPCMYLWLAALLEVYQMIISKEANISWNKLNVIKMISTLLLILLQIIDISRTFFVLSREENKVFNADYYGPAVKFLTFALTATLIFYNKKCGMRTSGVLFIFWLLLIFTGLPQLRTEIRNYKDPDTNNLYNVSSYIVYYFLVIIMFLLSCFADLPPIDTPYVYDKRQLPEDASGFLSRLTFAWFDPIAITGYRRTLTDSDLYSLSPKINSKESLAEFEKKWKRALKKQGPYRKPSELEISETSSLKGHKKEKKIISVVAILFKAFGVQFLIAMVLKFCNDILLFASPQLLRLLIGFVGSDEPVWQGYLYAVTMLLCATIQTMFLGQYFIKISKVGVKISCALSSMVYKKALCLSNEARKTSTVGEIMNLMSTDVSRFNDLTLINMLWSGPLQVALTMYFLWGVLGPSTLAGLAVIIVLMPVNAFFAGVQKKFQTKLMRYKDERIKLMTEILNGMKVLKIYAWEPSFQEYILQIRNKELKIMRTMIYYGAISAFVWFCSTITVSLMSFACFVLVNDTEVLDAKRAFVALSLFNVLRWPMTVLPNVISNAIQTYVSLKRLNKFLNADELDVRMIEHNPNEPDQIVAENGYFSWNGVDSEPTLTNLNLHIPRGALVAVVGTVGSGKSSLIAALLGEMDKVSGRVNVKGTTAYVTQQAWIQNATVQNNILFGKPLNKIKYNQILQACALNTDLAILPGGDQTEIGEKGINLSGGQKQRVSLARAVYFDADNYFLDDPLSAVDSHVGKHLFEEVIGPNGVLKNKTRIWVTHNVSYLAQTDLVLVLQDGQVREAGKYQELLEEKGAFADFLLHHLNNAGETDEDDDVSKDQQHLLPGALPVSETPGNKGDHDMKSNKEQLDANEEDKEYDQLIEAERAETGTVKWSVYKHYFLNVGVMASVISIMTYGVVHCLQITANFWLVRWSNDQNMLVNGTVDKNLRDYYLGVYGGIGLTHVTISIVVDLLPFLACWRAAKILHETLLNNLLRAPLHFFEVTPVGRIISRFSKDVDAVDTAIPWQLSGVISCTFEVLGTIFVISYSTPMFLAVVLPIGVVYLAIQRFYIPTSRQLMRIMSVARSPIFSHFNESILGASSIRAFGVKERFVKESQERVDHYQAISYLRSVADRWLGVRLQVVGSLIIFFAALFAVISRDTISPGLAGLSVSYTLEITQILFYLVLGISIIETDIVAVERMKEYAETEQEADWVIPNGPRSSWPETGSVQFEGLTMSYRSGAEPALRDVSCTVEPGDKIGIVGRTGAGKSTLTLGLFRIVEAIAGRILIDGLDIAKIGLHQLRSRITIIPQDPVLFAGTLRMNLDPFSTHSDNEIWHALELAHLKPFVNGLPAGLRHEVLESGDNLSVGQRQLVCLARALLRKTSLLVLDEATAAVDLETDDLIQKTIRTEFASCTVITIAHRLNTILDSTKVMVLDKGRLIEYAPPEQLLQNKNSMFYSLAKDADLVS